MVKAPFGLGTIFRTLFFCVVAPVPWPQAASTSVSRAREKTTVFVCLFALPGVKAELGDMGNLLNGTNISGIPEKKTFVLGGQLSCEDRAAYPVRKVTCSSAPCGCVGLLFSEPPFRLSLLQDWLKLEYLTLIISIRLNNVNT